VELLARVRVPFRSPPQEDLAEDANGVLGQLWLGVELARFDGQVGCVDYAA
jgi:hypothetical protein